MANFNEVRLIGRLTSDITVNKLPSGDSVGNFSIASSRKYINKNEEKVEETTFVDCEIFGRGADLIKEYTQKGSELLVAGRLRQDKWDDKDTGGKRSKLVVNVQDFQFLSGGKDKPVETPTKESSVKPDRTEQNKGKRSNEQSKTPW